MKHHDIAGEKNQVNRTFGKVPIDLMIQTSAHEDAQVINELRGCVYHILPSSFRFDGCNFDV